MLIESISGIRATIGDSLTPAKVVEYAAAFGQWAEKGSIVLGRDSRVSGKVISDIAARTLQWMGLDLIDIGIVPTPTVQLMTEKLGARAGLAVTASHNPFPWNGLKFIEKTGLFLDAEQVAAVLKNKKAGKALFKAAGEFGEYRFKEDAIDRHVENVLSIPYIDVKAIRARKFRVVIDAVNGGGSLALPALLEKLGCKVIKLHCSPDGYFPHTPEPLPENLTDLMKTVKEEKADLGLAVDPDADRLAVVDEKGNYLSEEYTLVMAAEVVLSQTQVKDPIIVTNLSTTLAVSRIAEKYGAACLRTAIGEINVAKKMKEVAAVIGGEGNGGVISPDSHLGRDSLVGAAMVLHFLAGDKRPLSEKYAALPQYRMAKKKIGIAGKDPDAILTALKLKFAAEDCNTVDGLKISFPESWVHMRKSNTEPILRVYSEAADSEAANALGERFLDEIKNIMEQ
ncbi:MAG: phosphoglucosamine mutase [Candidatus Neomarinimicrobiota bacterium]|jgi:phosphomannomutase|nr:phosphoglucosamine mutase [Candidatus Neomarinimicrobiota bacterium]MDX9780127.1 phosphoglucosamine mutase [bacterium]